METSAELLYLLSKFDKDNRFGFRDELEKSEVMQWLFFWHGSGAPYQGNLSYFRRAQEKSTCELPCTPPSFRSRVLISNSRHQSIPNRDLPSIWRR